MKRRTLILAGLSAIMLSACQVFFVDDSDTSIVQFSASAGDARTKTEYGGDDGSGWELIKWLDTDQVTIHMSYTDEQNASIFDAPKDYGIKPNPDKDGGHISYGGLVPHSDPLRWHGHFVDGKPQEYAHQFYSAYPAGKGGFSESDHSFTFSLPDKQNGTMDCAYMAAVKEFQQPRENNEDKVQLDYYPLVTAVSVTLTNATGETIENLSKEITLSSTDGTALAGEFTAVVSGEKYVPGDILPTKTKTEISVTATATELADGKPISVHIFLLPRESYTTSNLILTIGQKEYSLGGKGIESFKACLKYNINFTLTSGGLQFDGITDGAAQLIFSWLLNSGRLGDLGIDYNEFNISRNNNWDGNIANALLSFFKNADGTINEEKWQKLLEILMSATDISFSDKIIKNPIKPEDFKKFFPNISKIDLKTEADFEIDGLDNLSTIHLYDHPTSVTIQNCEHLSTIFLENCDGEGTIKITDCPELEYIKQGNEWWSGPLGNTNKDFILENLASLKEFEINDAKSITLKNAPNCSKVNVQNANNLTKLEIENIIPDNNLDFSLNISNASDKLTEITLKDIPQFNGGAIGGNVKELLLTIDNCSNAKTGNVYLYKPNGSTTVTKNSSDKVIVQ